MLTIIGQFQAAWKLVRTLFVVLVLRLGWLGTFSLILNPCAAKDQKPSEANGQKPTLSYEQKIDFSSNYLNPPSDCGSQDPWCQTLKGIDNNASGPANTSADSSSAQPKEDTSPYGLCVSATKVARAYCSDPIKYSTDGAVEMANNGNLALATNLVMVGAASAATSGGAQSTAALCNVMEAGGAGLTGANAIFAGRCNNFVSDCVEKCQAAQAADPTHLHSDLNILLNTCSDQREKAIAMGGSAAQSLFASQMGRLCGDAAKAASKPLAVPAFNLPPSSVDCTNPTNAANPLCRGLDMRAAVGGTGVSDFTGSGSSSGKGSDFNVGDVGDELVPDVPVPGAEVGDIKNPGIANGGGSMLGGDKNGSGLGGGDDRGRSQGPGHNANIMQGERGGGGYSQSGGVGGGSGGWGGYGGGNDRDSHKVPPFDMSKFLPGQPNGPSRGPAGLGSARAVLAPMQDDIFKRISDQVQVVCRTKFLDCRDK